MNYFDNQFLFSETYINNYIKENSKKMMNQDGNLVNMFTNIVDWNKEFTTGDCRHDSWEEYIDALLIALGFVNKEVKENIRVLYTNPITSGGKPVAICYGIDKEEDVSSTIKGKYYAYNAVKSAKENNVEWAILTNGYKWRLYNTKNISPYESYLEVDTEASIKEYDKPNEAFQLFYLFFNVKTYYTKEDGQLKIERLKDESDKTAETIEEFLRGKSEEILKDLCYGLKENMNQQFYVEEDRKNIYSDAIILLYRLLFLGYAEARALLPIKKDDPDYTESFERLCYDAKEVMNSGQLPSIKDGFEFWDRIDSHLRVYVDNCYNGGLFHNDDKFILREHRIANEHLVKCLAEISYNKDKNEKYTTEIQYKDLSVRNLGAIYEGLLEYRLFVAEETMVQRKNKNKVSYIKESETTLKTSDLKNIIKIGEIYLSQDAMERKETGAYYTPEDIVEYIVGNTVGKKINELRQQLKDILQPYYDELQYQSTEQGKRTLQNNIDLITYKFVNEKILTLSIIDSAMGSGHFLVNAVYRVSNEIVSIIEDNCWQSMEEIPVDIKEWKRKVVENCIYGIDINELSVALARLSLWLISASNDKALSFIDHHLKTGDSIIGATKSQIKLVSDEKSINIFDILPDTMLEPVIRKFDKIKEVGSSTKYDVEIQKSVYKQIEEELYLIKKKFDYYLATIYAGGIEDENEYINIMRFGTISDFENLKIKPLMKYAKENKFFHWELEFPQVFTNGGFDIAIGNPPYVEVDSKKYEKVIGKISQTKNLYSYMINNYFNYTKEDAKISVIVLMSLIASQKMKYLRQKLMNIKGNIYFMNIDSATYPGRLFKGLMIRLTILTVARNINQGNHVFSTNYMRFYHNERKNLFKDVYYGEVDLCKTINKKYLFIPKLGSVQAVSILKKIYKKTNITFEKYIKKEKGCNSIYYRNTGAVYYCMAFDAPPYYTLNGKEKISSTITKVEFKDVSKYIPLCIFHSSLFYWFWTVYSDCYHLTGNDLKRFPIDLADLQNREDEFEGLYHEITKSLNQHKKLVKYNKSFGVLEYDEYRHRYSKKVFDSVDRILADYYNLTESELDFIVNYDYKYRVGERNENGEL